jgi:hypothetical protein
MKSAKFHTSKVDGELKKKIQQQQHRSIAKIISTTAANPKD